MTNETLTLKEKTQILSKTEEFHERIARIVEESNNTPKKPGKAIEIFSEGHNAKLCAVVSIINLPPIATCPNCASCSGSCYATLRYGAPTVTPRWDRNLAMTKREDFVELATRELRYKGTKIVRYHESGDFYSDDYINKCMELAIENPQVFFYGYTKNKKALKLNVLKNVNVIYSLVETGTPLGEVRNYGNQEYCEFLRDNFNVFICPHTNEWKAEGKSCMGTCQECMTRDKVCFIEHGRKAKTDKYSSVMLEYLKKELKK